MIITRIEKAMIDWVNAVNAVPTFGALLKTVDRYSGEFAAEDLDLLVSSAPFVLISHTRSQVLLSSGTGSQWLGEFTVIAGSTSRRTRAQALASRVGGPAPPNGQPSIELGSRQIAEIVRDLLSGEHLGLPISVLEPTSLDDLYSGQAGAAGNENFLSVTGIQFTTRYSTTRSNPAASAKTKLEQIVATFAANIGDVTIDDPANNTVTANMPQGASS